LYLLQLDGNAFEVDVQEDGGAFLLTVKGQHFAVQAVEKRPATASALDAQNLGTQATPGVTSHVGAADGKPRSGAVTSPMTGVLIEVLRGEGEQVAAGEGVAILEAMKTENVIRASIDGTVERVEASQGQTLRMDDIIMYIEPEEG
jgi:biotin carboxyl carrier protein